MDRMTDLEKVKDFLEWAERGIFREKDTKLREAMIKVRDKFVEKLKEEGKKYEQY